MKHLIAGLLVLTLFFSWRSFTSYSDSRFECDISIKTSMELNNRTIKKALGILKYGMPEQYLDVCKNIAVIETGTACGGFGGGCFYTRDNSDAKGRIYVSVAQGQVLDSAAIIVHELCHLYQHREGRPFDEDECYRADHAVFQTLAQF